MSKKVLAVLIAKSGVSLLDVLPREWEVVVADYSRLDQREVQWWSRPVRKRYDEIVIVDQNIITGLTQLRLERELRQMGIEGPVRYAGNPKTVLGYRHMHYLLTLTKEGLVPKPAVVEPPSDIYLNRYMIALVGLPAAGKTLLRHLFSRWQGFSVYKWGTYLRAAVEETLGPMTPENPWEKVRCFTEEVEAKDRTVVARKFLERSGIRSDPATFAVVDGVKSREQIIYVSYALRRPVIIVEVRREEKSRLAEALKRGDFDDRIGEEQRLEILAKMGALEVIRFADFVVDTTGCRTDYNEATRFCRLVFTERFIAGMHELLSWIFVSDSLETTKELICRASHEVAESRGYAAEVKVVP
jgi:dephospho-CoA kinase